jgi:F-type H+-transporting ATPase subunit b
MLIDLTFDLSLPVLMAIFIAQYFVVRKFFLEPLNNVMTERQAEITSAAARHEETLARFNEATSEMEQKLGEARKQGSAIREALRAEATTNRNAVVAKTREEADGIVRSAATELEAAVVSARRKIDSESESLARLAAERILGRAL